MKEDNKARFRAQGEGGVQGMTAKHKTILAVFGLAFGVIPWAVATGPVHP